MGEVAVKQSVKLLAGKLQSSTVGPTLSAQIPVNIIDKDLNLDSPNEDVFTATDYNECSKIRFMIPIGSTNLLICLGTVSLAKVFIIKSDQDVDVKITNTNGQSQNLTFISGRLSILHVSNMSELRFTNNQSTNITGWFFVAGD